MVPCVGRSSSFQKPQSQLVVGFHTYSPLPIGWDFAWSCTGVNTSSQFLEDYIYNCPAASRKFCFLEVDLYLWLLRTFCPLFCKVPESWWEECKCACKCTCKCACPPKAAPEPAEGLCVDICRKCKCTCPLKAAPEPVEGLCVDIFCRKKLFLGLRCTGLWLYYQLYQLYCYKTVTFFKGYKLWRYATQRKNWSGRIQKEIMSLGSASGGKGPTKWLPFQISVNVHILCSLSCCW